MMPAIVPHRCRRRPLSPTLINHMRGEAQSRCYSLEIDRRLGRQTAFDRPGALVGEHLARAGFQGIEGGADHALRGDLGDVQSTGQIGIDKADVQPENLRSLLRNSLRRPLVKLQAAALETA